MKNKQDILDFLDGTAAVNPDGNPIVLHHGTIEDFSEFNNTRDIGYHFGTIRQASEREGEVQKEIRKKTKKKADGHNWNRLAVVLAIRNPFKFRDDPRTWPVDYVTRLCSGTLTQEQIRRMREVDEECLSAARAESAAIGIKSDGAWSDIWSKHNAIALSALRGMLEEQGYDGIIYPNKYEKDGGKPSWVAFRPESIRIIGRNLDIEHIDIEKGDIFRPGNNPTIAPERDDVRPMNSGYMLSKANLKKLRSSISSYMSSAHSVNPDVTGHWVIKTPSGNLHVSTEAHGKIRILITDERGLKFDKEDIPEAFTAYIDDPITSNVTGIPQDRRTFEWGKGESLTDTISRFKDFMDTIGQALSTNPDKAFGA